ncbi:MAG: tetratricopeptide repeat protein, partial [Desulfomonilaceae bacterium]
MHRENFPPPGIIHGTAFHSSAKTAQYINRLGSRWKNNLTCFLGTNLAALCFDGVLTPSSNAVLRKDVAMKPLLLVLIVSAVLLPYGTVAGNDTSPPPNWGNMIGQAQQYQGHGMAPDAMASAQRSFQYCAGSRMTDDKRRIKSLALVGALNAQQDNLELAARALRRGRTLSRSVYGQEHPNSIAFTCSLAEVYLRDGRQADAEALFKEVTRMLDAPGRKIDSATARSLVGLASIHATRGEYPKAQALYERAIAVYEPLTKYQPVVKGDLVKAIFASGQLAHAQGNYGKASEAYRHALLYLDSHPGRNALAASRILWSLGD